MRGYDPTEISYRKAELSDLQMLVEMENASFRNMDRFSRRKIRGYLRNSRNSSIVDVIEVRGEPAGYSVFLTRAGSRTASLHTICILSRFRGRGVALSYLRTRMGEMPESIDRVILRVRKGNKEARQLYLSVGFVEEGQVAEYYPDGEDALKMTITLKREAPR